MTQPSLVVAADQADALLTLRRATYVLATAVLFVLVTQLTLFLGIRYWNWLAPVAKATAGDRAGRLTMQYLVGLIDFAGIILPTLLSVTLGVALLVQIAGRLAGAGRTTAAVVWSVGLALLLFPWQSVLNNPGINHNAAENAIGSKIPGVVFTWAEVSHEDLGGGFKLPERSADPWGDRMAYVLHWVRYAGFPLAAMAVLALTVANANRGLFGALGGGRVAASDPPPPIAP